MLLIDELFMNSNSPVRSSLYCLFAQGCQLGVYPKSPCEVLLDNNFMAFTFHLHDVHTARQCNVANIAGCGAVHQHTMY